jgi:hypothetical protein
MHDPSFSLFLSLSREAVSERGRRQGKAFFLFCPNSQYASPSLSLSLTYPQKQIAGKPWKTVKYEINL